MINTATVRRVLKDTIHLDNSKPNRHKLSPLSLSLSSLLLTKSQPRLSHQLHQAKAITPLTTAPMLGILTRTTMDMDKVRRRSSDLAVHLLVHPPKMCNPSMPQAGLNKLMASKTPRIAVTILPIQPCPAIKPNILSTYLKIMGDMEDIHRVMPTTTVNNIRSMVPAME